MLPEIKIYTDGSALGNPGPGGYGVVLLSGQLRNEISDGYRLTTNNRMELLAVIIGLEALSKMGSDVSVYTDSKYVADSVTEGWVFKWERKAFKNMKNVDLWKRFLIIYRQHKVVINWIKGHNNNPDNDRCDMLAVKASKSSNLKIDIRYEENQIVQSTLF